MDFFNTILANFKEIIWWGFLVQPWEQGLRVRFGKKIKRYGGGLHFKLPFVDKIYLQNTRLRITDLASQTLTTADGKTVTLSGALQYRVKDIMKLYMNLHMAENTVAQLVQGAIAKHITAADLGRLKSDLWVGQVMRECNGTLHCWGLSQAQLIITDFAVVKTYRLITGELYKYNEHALQTDAPEESI